MSLVRTFPLDSQWGEGQSVHLMSAGPSEERPSAQHGTRAQPTALTPQPLDRWETEAESGSPAGSAALGQARQLLDCSGSQQLFGSACCMPGTGPTGPSALPGATSCPGLHPASQKGTLRLRVAGLEGPCLPTSPIHSGHFCPIFLPWGTWSMPGLPISVPARGVSPLAPPSVVTKWAETPLVSPSAMTNRQTRVARQRAPRAVGKRMLLGWGTLCALAPGVTAEAGPRHLSRSDPKRVRMAMTGRDTGGRPRCVSEAVLSQK